MTTSTAKKPKGPLRTEALVPSLIIIGLTYGYFHFLFDGHLRRGMEFAASRIHGAEVNIADVNTSVFRASFRMAGLQVTDKKTPARNLFQVGEVRFGMLWDALLRAKFVVEEASILDIQAFTPRKSPGFVLPPPPPEGSLIGKVQAEVVAQTRQKMNDNFLGDIASVLGGVDPKDQLKNIQAELKSTLQAEKLEKELTAKKAEWEKRIKEMPRPEEIKALEAKVKALDLKTKNPIELAKNLKQANEILGEAKAKVEQVNQGQKDLTGDITNYTKAVADLEKLAAQDVADLQKRLQIPSINPKEFSTQLFLAQLEGRLVSLRKYVALARRYLPPKKTAEEKAAERAEAILPPARGEGVNFAFPVTTGYPLFWLKKGAISSELTQSEWAGKVAGAITDLTTDPVQLGRPLKVVLNGDFPKQQVLGVEMRAVIDHTTENPRENVLVKVGSFPLVEQLFSNSESVKFGLKNAVAAGSLEGALAGEALTVGVRSRFEKMNFLVEAKNSQVQQILGSVVQGIPVATMDAKVTGSWDNFAIDIDSNLGQAISAGFQKEMQAKLGEAQAKLDSFVQEKLLPAKKKAQSQLEALTGGPGKLLGQNKSEMEGALKGAEGSTKTESPGRSLLKGFGF
jgi:uncharacterized protein (TIGR03545 family)